MEKIPFSLQLRIEGNFPGNFMYLSSRWGLLKALSTSPGMGPELSVNGKKAIHFLKTTAFT